MDALLKKTFYIGAAGQLCNDVDGKAYVQAKPDEVGCVVYGPYQYLEPGSYEVTFELVAGAEFKADGRNFCSLEVVSSFGRIVISSALVNSDGVKKDAVTPVVLCFAVEQPTTVEYRLDSFGTHPFSVNEDRQVNSVVLAETEYGNYQFYKDSIDKFVRYSVLGAQICPLQDGVIVDFMGVKALVKNREEFQLIEEIFRCNSYKFATDQNVCVIDVGMNVGLASLYFAKMPEVQVVHAFEPFYRPFARALENFALNPELSSKIRPNPSGWRARLRRFKSWSQVIQQLARQ
jgi:hypothetical protein